MKRVKEVLASWADVLGLRDRGVAWIWLLPALLLAVAAWVRLIEVRAVEARMDEGARASLAEHLRVSEETKKLVGEMMEVCAPEAGPVEDPQEGPEKDPEGEIAPGDW